jgi:hypothetical protein
MTSPCSPHIPFRPVAACLPAQYDDAMKAFPSDKGQLNPVLQFECARAIEKKDENEVEKASFASPGWAKTDFYDQVNRCVLSRNAIKSAMPEEMTYQ